MAACLATAAAQGGAAAVAAAGAQPAPAGQSVEYRGYALVVPSSWPVYHLDSDRTRCVAFNQHAVYLGQPGPAELCPPHAAGHTEAVLVQPLASATPSQLAHASAVGAGHVVPAGVAVAAQEVSFAVPAAGVLVTATWNLEPALVQTALAGAHLTGAARAGAPSVAPAASPTHSAAVAPAAGYVNGLGFDSCAAPSSSEMSAWRSGSPYASVGIYIGGVNRACAQANLTAGWVSSQAAAGWRFIPTYVGLQAPGNGCGCSAISPSAATSQGATAADDAAAQARPLGLSAGSAIYFDMESYAPGTSNTPAVLAFLSAWSSQIHADGYLSGVYSSGSTGISDLVSQYGTSYTEPDEIWIADWNGQQTTADQYVPGGDWSNHQRLHQYQGGHTETHAGVSINIDGDYLDGAVAPAVAQVTDAQRSYLALLYLDVLGRAVDQSGDTYWLPQVVPGGGTQDQRIGAAFTASLEYRYRMVNEIYLRYLGHTPDSEGQAYWSQRVMQGSSYEQVRALVIGSAESFVLSGDTTAGYIARLYGEVLYRAPSAADQSYWQQQLTAGVGPATVAAAILTSDEGYANYINVDVYRPFLRRSADQQAFSFWTPALRHGLRDEAFVANIVGSPEYWGYASTHQS